MTTRVTFLGHATLQVDVGEHSVLIDPFLTDNPSATTTADAVNPSAIIVTHGHGDHVGDTVAIAKRYGAKVISIEKRDFTFGRALNYGCEAATGDILLIASAHVFPTHSSWVQEMVAPFENPHVRVVYGRQSGCETTKFSEHCLFSRWFPPVSDWDQASNFCNNANCAIRRADCWW